jgi:DNA-binding transcriptional LysR family regulator
MDLRQLSYFVAVAEEAQFTRAAARLSVAQPAVSAQIQNLERELGEALFHREQRNVALTPAGEALLPHARAALAAAERGREEIVGLRGLLHGRLRIGISRPVDERLVKTLGEFHRTHPEIEISVTEAFNDPLIEALQIGAVDVAVIGMRRRPPPPEIRTRVIASEPLVLAATRDHPLSRRRSITINDLRDEPMVTLARGSGLRTMLDNASRDAGFTLRIAAETEELGVLVELASEGLGLAVAPRSAFAGADLALVPVSRPQLIRRTALAWNEAVSSPAARAFLTLAEKRLPGEAAAKRRPRSKT